MCLNFNKNRLPKCIKINLNNFNNKWCLKMKELELIRKLELRINWGIKVIQVMLEGTRRLLCFNLLPIYHTYLRAKLNFLNKLKGKYLKIKRLVLTILLTIHQIFSLVYPIRSQMTLIETFAHRLAQARMTHLS